VYGHRTWLIPCAIVITLAVCWLPGCGGGGGAAPPPPPPPPPPVEIGPGPGPAASAIPAEPAVSTVAARAVPFASAPSMAVASAEAVARIDALADRPPATQAELEAVLSDFTRWASAQPNDPLSQAGLAAAIVICGAHNAGISAGYTPSQVLSLLEPVTQIASLRATMRSAAFPSPGEPDFSSANLQIGVRKFLLPALVHARLRLDAVVSTAGGSSVRLAELPSRRGTHYAYRADFRALSGVLRGAQAILLQLCAYQFNPGTWDWTAALAGRDVNHDGLLQTSEYLPPDPFGWRHNSSNMALSGTHITGALQSLIDAVREAPADSLLMQVCAGDRTTALAKLTDLQAMASGEVQARIEHEGGSGGAGSFTTPMRLKQLWEAPTDDLKDLFPTLAPASGSYWEALPRGASDFPRPQLGGVFAQPAPVMEMLAKGPTYIAMSYGSFGPITVIDRRGQ